MKKSEVARGGSRTARGRGENGATPRRDGMRGDAGSGGPAIPDAEDAYNAGASC